MISLRFFPFILFITILYRHCPSLYLAMLSLLKVGLVLSFYYHKQLWNKDFCISTNFWPCPQERILERKILAQLPPSDWYRGLNIPDPSRIDTNCKTVFWKGHCFTSTKFWIFKFPISSKLCHIIFKSIIYISFFKGSLLLRLFTLLRYSKIKYFYCLLDISISSIPYVFSSFLQGFWCFSYSFYNCFISYENESLTYKKTTWLLSTQSAIIIIHHLSDMFGKY